MLGSNCTSYLLYTTPGRNHMALFGVCLANAQPQRVATVQFGVRQVEIAAVVETL